MGSRAAKKGHQGVTETPVVEPLTVQDWLAEQSVTPVSVVRLSADMSGLLGVHSLTVGVRVVSLGTVTGLELRDGVLHVLCGDVVHRVIPGVGVAT